MYMFRAIFKTTHIKQFYRNFSKDNIPTFSVVWSEKDGITVEIKEDTTEWKATKGNGKSIYDCENESWCVPEKPRSDEWEEANKRED